MSFDYKKTWLWRQSFETARPDTSSDEQEFFRSQYITMRNQVKPLVAQIAKDFSGLTVHDITHLDALWDTASLIAEGAVEINPAEAFVLGASILLHDAALSLAAYPGGLNEVKQTTTWQDALARHKLTEAQQSQQNNEGGEDVNEHIKNVLPDVLRRLHAEKAAVLAQQAWRTDTGEHAFLIENLELRGYYGTTIGQIAHSHWWPVQRLEEEFSQNLGALAAHTHHDVDKLKLACILRIADALHLDHRRAPRFLRTLVAPTGNSMLHWAFQERLGRPQIELDAVVFTTGKPFERAEAESWWLAYDTINAVDRELRDVDQLLQGCSRDLLRARRVKGAGTPEGLAKTIHTSGWRPVDTRLHVSDVPRIVESLGGAKLYGDDPTIALRELIQNAADAVQARRRFEQRPDCWGEITVSVFLRDSAHWLSVEDTGIGMSEAVLTGPLLDFGTSFWKSPMALDEFPGLIASGMRSIGRFGIGFFSVFMLAEVVRVISKRCDKGSETARCMEFREGTSARPILSQALREEIPKDGGTRVELKLLKDPSGESGLLWSYGYSKTPLSLSRVVTAVAPNLDVAIVTLEEGKRSTVLHPGDWLTIGDEELLCRLDPYRRVGSGPGVGAQPETFMRPIRSRMGELYGRACIMNWRAFGRGWVTVGGLRANRMANVAGILNGEAVTAARDMARPFPDKEALAEWATDQANIIGSEIDDEEEQARAAEVVLECGGDIGDLAIIRVGSTWMTRSEFREYCNEQNELVITFGGKFDYDEDRDSVHPSEFRENFELGNNIGVVARHNGEIVGSRTNSWPRSITGVYSGVSNLQAAVVRIVREAWGDDYEMTEEVRIVGEVSGTEIERKVAVFCRPS